MTLEVPCINPPWGDDWRFFLFKRISFTEVLPDEKGTQSHPPRILADALIAPMPSLTRREIRVTNLNQYNS